MKRFMVVLLVVCCVILCVSFSFAQQKRPITEKDLPVMIDDLFLVGNGSQKRLTALNAKLCGELNLTMPEDITYTSFDGKKIEGFVQKPPDFDPNKDYAASELWTAIPCGSPEYRRVVPTSESTIRKPIAIRALSVLIQRRTIISELFRARSPSSSPLRLHRE